MKNNVVELIGNTPIVSAPPGVPPRVNAGAPSPPTEYIPLLESSRAIP